MKYFLRKDIITNLFIIHEIYLYFANFVAKLCSNLLSLVYECSNITITFPAYIMIILDFC